MRNSDLSAITGAQAVAGALEEAGVEVFTHVPGHGATAIFESLTASHAISYHEEVAYAVAHAAALTGTRAAVIIKSHGVAKAANAILSSLSCGVTAAFVVIVADDRAGVRSDNIFDASHLLAGLGLPFTRADAVDAQILTTEAVMRSERTSLPQAVLIDAEVLHAHAPPVEAAHLVGAPPIYQRDVARHLVCPLFTRYQAEVLELRRAGLDAGQAERPAIPAVGDLPKAWQPGLEDYRVFFEAFESVERDFTAGDTSLCSLYALPPFDAVDAITYYGGSLPLAIGAWLGGARRVWAVSGDFSFLAAGALGLVEAAHREAPIKVVIFENGRAEATGGQPVEAADLDRVLAGYEVLSAYGRDSGEVRNALRHTMPNDAPWVLRLRF